MQQVAQQHHFLPPSLLVPWLEEIWKVDSAIGTAKLVLIAIAWATELDGKARLPIPELCKRTGLAKSTIGKQLLSLERSDLLWIEHHKGPAGSVFQVLIGDPLAYLQTLREHAHTVRADSIDLRIKSQEVRSGRLHPDSRCQGPDSTLS